MKRPSTITIPIQAEATYTPRVMSLWTSKGEITIPFESGEIQAKFGVDMGGTPIIFLGDGIYSAPLGPIIKGMVRALVDEVGEQTLEEWTKQQTQKQNELAGE